MLLISFSHELKTPLHGSVEESMIIGVLAILPLLKERLVDKQDKYDIDTAITSSKFLNNYINNCLVICLVIFRTI